jgi:anti-sigma factor ChrR (cupin superfamily)
LNRGYQKLASLYAIGALDSEEKARFEEHIRGCTACRSEIMAYREALARMTTHQSPRRRVWRRINDFIEIPKAPLDVSRYTWNEVDAGVRMSVFREDLQRGVRTLLMWANPEAHRPPHHHFADEEILVLSGSLRIGEQIYATGEICYIRAGTEHIEQVDAENECLCAIVHRSSERPLAPRGTLDKTCRDCAFRVIHEAVFQREAI